MAAAFLCLAFLSVPSWGKPFSDAELARLRGAATEEKKGILIYSWSPHMLLSIRGLDEALAREKRGGPRVVAVLDPGSSLEWARKVARKHGWPEEVLRTQGSKELGAAGFRVHYPSYVLLGPNAKSPVIPGYKSENELAFFFRPEAE